MVEECPFDVLGTAADPRASLADDALMPGRRRDLLVAADRIGIGHVRVDPLYPPPVGRNIEQRKELMPDGGGESAIDGLQPPFARSCLLEVADPRLQLPHDTS